MGSELKRIIEGLLFTADAPLSLNQLMRVLENPDRAMVREQVDELIAEYETLDRAFVLVEVAGGYRLRTRPELSPWLRRLRSQQVTRLSRAALETLAIIAYKQPVLRAEVERVRGVDVGGVLRMLMEKDLIRVLGRQDLPGKPLIYGTTKRFLEVFDLKSLKDLPSIEEMAALAGEDADEEPPGLFDEPRPEEGEGGEEGEEYEDDLEPGYPLDETEAPQDESEAPADEAEPPTDVESADPLPEDGDSAPPEEEPGQEPRPESGPKPLEEQPGEEPAPEKPPEPPVADEPVEEPLSQEVTTSPEEQSPDRQEPEPPAPEEDPDKPPASPGPEDPQAA